MINEETTPSPERKMGKGKERVRRRWLLSSMRAGHMSRYRIHTTRRGMRKKKEKEKERTRN